MFDSQGRRIAEYNQATGALIREYVWLNWEPVAVIEGGVTYLVRTDHIGRPVFATNTAGTQVWTATYDPFGGVRTTTGTPINALRGVKQSPGLFAVAPHPGQWFQSESGLHQNWMRDYDPTTGRYLQADPLGLVDGASVYGYALQSPMTNADPKGESCISANGQTSCGVGGKYFVTFPTPAGWDPDGYIGPGNGGVGDYYHFYDRSVIDPRTYDVDCLLKGLTANPDPSPSNGASSSGTRNYANPGGFGDYLYANPVNSYTFTSPMYGSGIVNVTDSFHALSDGIVVRIATPHGIQTYGEGNGILQSPGSPFAGSINGVWWAMNQAIIDQCKCEGQY